MQIKIALPDDVGQFLIENPEAGRRVIAKRFDVDTGKARLYSGIASIISNACEDQDCKIAMLDECDVEENLTTNEKGSITVKGKCLKSEYNKEGIIKRAIGEAGVDHNEWIIDGIAVRKWHTTMKVKVGDKETPTQVVNWLVGLKLKPNGRKVYSEALELLVTGLNPIKAVSMPRLPKKEMLAGEIAPVDAHIGKYAWHEETLGGNMDVPIATKGFQDACESNLSRMASHGLSKIFLVLGHDLMHIENQAGETPASKHRLDYDTRLPIIISETEKVVVRVVDQCLQVAPTEVIWVPGNHDWHASYWLCRVLAARYANVKHVKVDIGASMRKMILWGDVLIGLAHNAEGRKKAATVNLLAQYDPWKTHWSKARWTELHTGHLHKREVTTIGGTIHRRLSALSTIDFWHANEGFTDAVPACESFVFHKKEGLWAEYVTNVDYLKAIK